MGTQKPLEGRTYRLRPVTSPAPQGVVAAAAYGVEVGDLWGWSGAHSLLQAPCILPQVVDGLTDGLQ